MGFLRNPFRPAEAKVRVADGQWGAHSVNPTFRAHHGTKDINRVFADTHFVYEVVNRIGTAASTLPIKVLQHTDEGRADRSDHESARLIRLPNPETPRSVMVTATVCDLCLQGNAFWLKVRSATGKVAELWRLRPERMTPVPDPETGMLLGWIHTIGNHKAAFETADVVHFRTYNPLDDYIGLSPIGAMRYQVELGRDSEDAAIDLWTNGARTTGVLETPNALSEEAIEKLAAQFRMLGTRGGRYRTPILEEGLNYKQTMLNFRDAEFIQTFRITRERVAQAFGYPISEQYSARATPDEIRKALFADAVLPWSVLIEETLELTLFEREWPEERLFPEFQMRHILDPNVLERFQAYKEGVYAGWLPPQHVAKLEDIPTDAGPTYIPMNMSEVDEEGHVIPNPNAGPGKDSTGGMGGDVDDGPSTGSGNAKVLPWRGGQKKGARTRPNGSPRVTEPGTGSDTTPDETASQRPEPAASEGR